MLVNKEAGVRSCGGVGEERQRTKKATLDNILKIIFSLENPSNRKNKGR